MGKQGAEKLLGRGDMYFVDPSLNVPIRIQGPLLTDQEIDSVVAFYGKNYRHNPSKKRKLLGKK